MNPDYSDGILIHTKKGKKHYYSIISTDSKGKKITLENIITYDGVSYVKNKEYKNVVLPASILDNKTTPIRYLNHHDFLIVCLKS